MLSLTALTETDRVGVMEATENILRVFASASADAFSTGLTWYDEANAYAKSLDPLFHRSAGVIAALSPKNGWANNKAKAAQLYRQNGDGTGVGMSVPVGKAIRIYNGEDALDVLGGAKTRNFFMTIVDPNHDVPVIDAHAFDIAVGRPQTDKERNALQRKGEYDRYAEAYVLAAQFTGLSPAQTQAIVWCAWREFHGKGWYG